jgi:hypothetical protein
MSLHQPRAKIKQPEGINYMIQEYHYSESDAKDYINMLIEKSEVYISKKGRGEKVAQMLTLEQLETQLENIRKFEIVLL